MSRPRPKFELTPDVLLRAYSIGLFPMAESREAESLFWVEPEARGIFPLEGLKVSRSLAKTLRADTFSVVADRDFAAVMKGCAARDKTWINAEILRIYGELHARGHAHSVEVYQGEALVGGLYGVSLGAAFFGESMFHLTRDASKVALIHLVARLRRGGFRLLDAQFVTPHLAGLGAVEISREEYRERLAAAVDESADFSAWPAIEPMSGTEALALAFAQNDGTNIASL
jgi:leucyl/phenylalanyl-tRNA---protein transferase